MHLQQRKLITSILAVTVNSAFAAPPPWQLGPVSGQLCATLDSIVAGEIMNISTLAAFKNKELDADKTMSLLMQTQQYIQQKHIDFARSVIVQQMEPSDKAFVLALQPQLLTVYQKCDLWISRFTMSKPENISDVDYSTMKDYCQVEPQNLYKSYCIPPEGKQCTEKAMQKGKEVWLKFKIKVGDELCKQLSVVNTMVQERLIDPQLTPCDDEFNMALVKHIEEHVEQVKAKCPPPPVVVSLETCAKDGNKAGKEAWNEFKDNAGDDLCGELANSDDLIKENSRSGDTDCDEAFNEKLMAYLEKRISKAKEKCADSNSINKRETYSGRGVVISGNNAGCPNCTAHVVFERTGNSVTATMQVSTGYDVTGQPFGIGLLSSDFSPEFRTNIEAQIVNFDPVGQKRSNPVMVENVMVYYICLMTPKYISVLKRDAADSYPRHWFGYNGINETSLTVECRYSID